MKVETYLAHFEIIENGKLERKLKPSWLILK